MNDELERAMRRTGALQPLVMLIVPAAFVALGMNLGWATSGSVFALAALAELWQLGLRRANRLKLARPALWAGLHLSAMCIASCVWTGVAVLLWTSADPALRVGAMVLLATLLMDGIGQASSSRLAGAAFSAPPAAAIVILPMALGGFDHRQQWLLGCLVVMALAYLARVAAESVRQAEALRQANARLQDQEAVLQEETRRAQQANEAKSKFLAMMSHELRTPMNGVLGMARALGDTRLNVRQTGYVNMLIRSGDGLLGILNDLLDLSKAEAGKLELETIAFDLREIASRVHDLWADAASAKGVRLSLEIDLPGDWWVMGDPTRLRQILLNLVSNALKFTADGEVRLSITKVGVEGDADLIRFDVCDTGIGMTQTQLRKLFQPFVQADQSTTREFGGTGLGLSICQSLAGLMGSSVIADSKPGEGSRFHFTLRLPPAEAAPSEEPDTPALSIAGVRILVADDNAINLAVAQALLGAFGAVVVTAPDGAAALAILRTEAIDVVLMDVHMPVMGGVTALTAIRAGEAGRSDIPVIALTADAMSGVDEQLLDSGFDAVESKPIVPARLLCTLAEQLAKTGEQPASRPSANAPHREAARRSAL